MKLTEIEIENFRNFESAKVVLDNRNVFFGMNDVGKTNFLYAIRLLLEPHIRKQNVFKQDFHNYDDTKEIKIQLKIDISESANANVQNIKAKAGGAVQSNAGNDFYIKLTAKKEPELGYVIKMFWGNDIDDLDGIPQVGNYYVLDKLFNVVYLNSYLDMDKVFKNSFARLVDKNPEELEELENTIKTMNESISAMPSIVSAKNKLNEEFKKFNIHDFSLELQTTGLDIDPYKNIAPFIKKENDNNTYPMAGDGQKKLTAYATLRLTSIVNHRINIFLIEEPENHLHRTTLLGLSKTLFNKAEFPFVFITTHSSELLTEMDEINLIRIFNDTALQTKSVFYKVGNEYKHYKKALNNTLSQALFYDKVLLVEGYSEKELFDYVLSQVCPNINAKGIEVLPVNGIAFEKYLQILKPLGIKIFVKTDNDIRKSRTGVIATLGINRINAILTTLSQAVITFNAVDITDKTVAMKKQLYANNRQALKDIETGHRIYLSQVDLENDLDEVLHDKLVAAFGDDPIETFQERKLYNMIELLPSLTKADCEVIIEHEHFKCLKDILL